MIDVGKLLAGVSPGTAGRDRSAHRARAATSTLDGNGMSLGVITGLNSDADPTTRTGMRPDGVPYCQRAGAVRAAAAAAELRAPRRTRCRPTARSTFALNAADAVQRHARPVHADIAMGISQTTLDQLGHHLVTSGGMCLGVGTTFIKQLNVGTIGILVPSLGDLAERAGQRSAAARHAPAARARRSRSATTRRRRRR